MPLFFPFCRGAQMRYSCSSQEHEAQNAKQESAMDAARKPEKWIQVSVVAKRLSCSRDKIYDLIAEGELEAIRLGARALRVNEASLEFFIEKNRVEAETFQAG